MIVISEYKNSDMEKRNKLILKLFRYILVLLNHWSLRVY